MAERVVYALVHGDEPEVFFAHDEEVISRLLALRVVAATAAADIPEGPRVAIRSALLQGRWADAVADWIGVTNRHVDVFPDEPVWSERELDEDMTSFEIRLAPIFRD